MTRDAHDGRSLRARWTRSFAGLVVLLVVGAAVGVLGTQLVSRSYREAAGNLEQQAGLLARLQGEVVTHAAASLRGGGTTDLRQLEAPVVADFARAADVLQDEESKAALRTAEQDWAVMAETVRAGGVSAASVLESVTEIVPPVLTALDDAAQVSRVATRAELERSGRVERGNLAVGVLLVVIAVGVCTRLVRRLTTEVLVPLEDLTGVAARIADGELHARAARTGPGEVGALASTLNDMAAAIARSQAQLVRDARHDGLTGLINRLGFDEALSDALDAPLTPGCTQALVFLDLDGFKAVNDLCGHAVGDALLVAVAGRLRALVRPGDVVARLGGDEFAMLLRDLPDDDAVRVLCARASDALHQPVELPGGPVLVGASVGVSLRAPGKGAEVMLREADLAMYEAKRARQSVPRPRSGETART